MTSKAISPGDIIDARCSKCKAITNHTLIALVGDVPAKVQCNTCGGTHKYRMPAEKTAQAKPVKEKVARKPRVSKTDPLTAAKIEWETSICEFDPQQATSYSMDIVLKPGMLIEHKAFGLGIVKATPGAKKAEILFKEGLKLLRCG